MSRGAAGGAVTGSSSGTRGARYMVATFTPLRCSIVVSDVCYPVQRGAACHVVRAQTVVSGSNHHCTKQCPCCLPPNTTHPDRTTCFSRRDAPQKQTLPKSCFSAAGLA